MRYNIVCQGRERPYCPEEVLGGDNTGYNAGRQRQLVCLSQAGSIGWGMETPWLTASPPPGGNPGSAPQLRRLPLLLLT